MKYKNGLFLFHRDLRMEDNVGLRETVKSCENVYTTFIFTPAQVTKANDFKSNNSVQFMIESLSDLHNTIQNKGGSLLIQYGELIHVLEQLIRRLKIDCLVFNEDLTPYARERTDRVKSLCKSMNIGCNTYQDYYLCVPGEIMTGQNTMYHKFTPFYEKMIASKKIERPHKQDIRNLVEYNAKLEYTISLSDAMTKFVGKINPDLLVRGGRKLGVEQLQIACRKLQHYDDTRDIMSIETSMLSAYIKYGCVSIREVYHELARHFGKMHELVRQLVWRDFFAHILYFYPENLGSLYSVPMSKYIWSKSKSKLNAWKRGETGVPLVDAGMRQLNKTGYMHNRARMIVATYLVKILHIDWREGEKYFAQKLVDYDVASNSGNWQSIVGGGVYSMPWFRIMSPWAQSQQYDSNAVYIKTWVPELTNVPPKHIHKWYEYCNNIEYKTLYRCPIVDYAKEKALFIDRMSDSWKNTV